MRSAVRILHVHSTFSAGGKEARAVRLMNAFGASARHVVISGVPGALGARLAIDPAIAADFPADHPPLTGQPSLGRYRALARYMAGFDLVLTYNWGAMDAVMARRLFGGPPLVHHEDGFNADEADGQKRSRILFRRFALPAAAHLVVPSERLERIALDIWRQPRGRLRRIANGVPVDRFADLPAADAIPGFSRTPGEVVIGTMAGLRAVKNLPALVRALAAAGKGGRLVIVGEGPERGAIAAEADRLGVADRVTMPGFLANPAGYVGLFDIFALSSLSEQFPISLVEAMAAGLPAISTEVGDVAAMVAHENRPWLFAIDDESGYAAGLAALMADGALRSDVGAANRKKAVATFSEDRMIGQYRAIYGAAIGDLGRLS